MNGGLLRSFSAIVLRRSMSNYARAGSTTVVSRHTATSAAEGKTISGNDALPFDAIPGPTGLHAVPVLGAALQFYPFTDYRIPTAHKLIASLHDKYGPTFRMMMHLWAVMTSSPSGIEDVVRNDGQFPIRPSLEMLEYYVEKNGKERGVGILEGEEWRKLRSALNKDLMRPASPHRYLLQQNQVADDLVRRMRTRRYTPEEFREELFKFAVESIAVVTFNKRLGFLTDDTRGIPEEYVNYLEDSRTFFQLLNENFAAAPLYKIYPTKTYRNFEKAANGSYGFGRKQVQEALRTMTEEKKAGTFDPTVPNLILTMMSNPSLTQESVVATLQDLLVAGTDSTAKNMSIFLLNLGLNPDKQQKLYEEIARVVGSPGGTLKPEHWEQMPYYRACQNESFRLMSPTSAGSARILSQDAVIDGYKVPKGTMVICNNARLCLSEEYFENPSQYLPERWLRDDSRKHDKPFPRFAFLPFGFGTRNCLGKRFALQEIWLGVVKILHEFQVKVENDGPAHELVYTTFGETKRPVRFTFTPRR